MLAFLRSVLSEPDGTGSTARCCLAALVAFVLGAGVTLLAKLHTPVTVADFNAFLGSAGTFLTVTGAVIYGGNKFADVLKSRNVSDTPTQK